MSQIHRVWSYKYFQNQEEGTYQTAGKIGQQKGFDSKNDRSRKFEEKKFQSIKRGNQSKSREKMYSSVLNDVKLSRFSNKLLTPNQNGSTAKSCSKQKSCTQHLRSIVKDKHFPYTSIASQQNKQKSSASKINQFDKSCPSLVKQIAHKKFQNDFQCLSNNQSLVRLRNSVRHVKTLQEQKQNYESKYRSRTKSSKKKGLICTLFEKSQEKKINESNIKSNKKLITIKSKFQTTEGNLEQAKSTPPSDIKRIILKRKNKENNLNNSTCFNTIVIEKGRSKSRPSKHCEQLTKKFNQTFQTMKKLSLHPHSSSKQRYQRLSKSKNKNLEKSHSKPLVKTFQTSQKKFQPTTASKSIISPAHINSSKAFKKITLNKRIQNSLDKIHQKYKFILNYLTDFDIINRLNGYELANQQQCKWILLIIDDVYEMIKHSEETKLKGLDHSRNYQYRNSCGSKNQSEKQVNEGKR